MFYSRVSEADGAHVPVQIEETEDFVRRESQELERILSSDCVSFASFDFGWDVSLEASAPYNVFPASLLKVCGEIGISLIIRVYPEREEME